MRGWKFSLGDDTAQTSAAASSCETTTNRFSTMVLEQDWDNESNYLYIGRICGDFDQCNQYDDSLLKRILFWIKVALVKVARSYYAYPLVLVLVPLAVGLCVGYLLGRRSGQNQQQKARSETLTLPSAWLHLGSAFGWRPWLETTKARRRTASRPHSPSKKTSVEASQQPTSHRTIHGGLPREEKITFHNKNNDLSAAVRETPALLDAEDTARSELQSQIGQAAALRAQLPSNLILPQHVAVVMDGNRRYGRQHYNDATSGHWDGCRKLLELTTWCRAIGIPCLTVYAFSTENWKRTDAEVAALFALFARYADELRTQAKERQFAVKILSTNHQDRIPEATRQALQRLEDETSPYVGLLRVNVCLSYGSRGEIVNACRTVAEECVRQSSSLSLSTKPRTSDNATTTCDTATQELVEEKVTEISLSQALLTPSDPDLLIRTSGEVRLSNFLLWQLAYAELFFVDKMWPAFQQSDFVDILLRYGRDRKRRFGK